MVTNVLVPGARAYVPAELASRWELVRQSGILISVVRRAVPAS